MEDTHSRSRGVAAPRTAVGYPGQSQLEVEIGLKQNSSTMFAWHCSMQLALTARSCLRQILINFLQVTAIAVYINVDWTKSVVRALGVAGEGAAEVDRVQDYFVKTVCRIIVCCILRCEFNSPHSCASNANSKVLIWRSVRLGDTLSKMPVGKAGRAKLQVSAAIEPLEKIQSV